MHIKTLGKHAISALTSASLGTLLIIAGPQPASAGNMNGVCESGEFCLYFNENYGGPLADMEFNEPNFQGKTFANSNVSRNDNSRSGKDRGFTANGCIYRAANYSGGLINTGVMNDWPSFGTANDTASSLRWDYVNLWCG